MATVTASISRASPKLKAVIIPPATFGTIDPLSPLSPATPRGTTATNSVTPTPASSGSSGFLCPPGLSHPFPAASQPFHITCTSLEQRLSELRIQLNHHQSSVVAAVRARVPPHHHVGGLQSSGSGSSLGLPSSGSFNRTSPRSSNASPPPSLAATTSSTSTTNTTNVTTKTNNNNTSSNNNTNHTNSTTTIAAAVAATVGYETKDSSPDAASARAARAASPPATIISTSSLSTPSPSPIEAEKTSREMVRTLEAEITKEHNRLMEMIAADGGGTDLSAQYGGKVLVVNTGGTFAMVPDKTGALGVSPGYLQSRLGEFPAFANWHSRLAIVDLPGGLLDSSAMAPRDWERIACFIYRLLPYYTGFVVIHGTDTLAYTASALSFMLRSISKSVVVTGAQISISQPINDGIDNLNGAVLACQQRVPSVCVFFCGKLIPGTRAVKVSSIDRDAFSAPKAALLGYYDTRLNLDREAVARLVQERVNKKTRLYRVCQSPVALIHLYPGMDPSSITYAVQRGSKGIILQAHGSGNAPTDSLAFVEAVCGAISSDVVVCFVTECEHGGVENTYATGLEALGCISCANETASCAYAKLCVLLGKPRYNVNRVRHLMSRSIVGDLDLPNDETSRVRTHYS